MMNGTQTIAVMATAAAVPTNSRTMKTATILTIVSFFMYASKDEMYKTIGSHDSAKSSGFLFAGSLILDANSI